MNLKHLKNNSHVRRLVIAGAKIIVVAGAIILCSVVVGAVGAGIGSAVPAVGTVVGLGLGLGLGAALGAGISTELASLTGKELEALWVIEDTLLDSSVIASTLATLSETISLSELTQNDDIEKDSTASLATDTDESSVIKEQEINSTQGLHLQGLFRLGRTVSAPQLNQHQDADNRASKRYSM